MRYKDVTYSGSKYRAVTFDSYRPLRTGETCSASNSVQVDNGYTTGNVYWFQYEPLQWRVLDASTGLVMCSTLIDSQPFNNFIVYGTNGYGESECWGDAGKTYYASNYACSSIRKWLNEDFFSTAFTESQQSDILTSTLNNDCWYTLEGGYSGYEKYDAPSTSDKIFLLSYDEILNSAYGFASWDTNDSARRLKGSDYAKCQGLWVTPPNYSPDDGCAYWCLRSPGYGSGGMCVVYYDGGEYGDFTWRTNETSLGVCPAFRLNLDSVITPPAFDGKVIEFGSYPQTEVKDSSLIAALNAQGGTWQSYGYYSGTGEFADGQMTAKDYMRYKDVTYSGSKYRAVTFDSYRPYLTDEISSASNTFQIMNGYTTGNVYWFKYEPLQWRVLDASTGLLMCCTLIDSQPYNNYLLKYGDDGHGDTAYWGDAGKAYYASNYKYSSIRKWLNDDFYNTAFTSSQKSDILTSTLSNKGSETLLGNSGYEEFDAPSTSDKIFLLSYDEVTNSGYGFATSWNTHDTARQLKGSDYAKCQGLGVAPSDGSTYDGCSIWRLRSPGPISFSVCQVYYDGRAIISDTTNFTYIGVCPALRLNPEVIASDDTGSDHTSGIWTYKIIQGYAYITKCNALPEDKRVTIPDTLDGYPVAMWYFDAFIQYSDFELVIPNSFPENWIQAIVETEGQQPDFEYLRILYNYALADCAVNAFTVLPGNAYLQSINGVLYNKDMSALIKYPVCCKAKSYELPATIDIYASCASWYAGFYPFYCQDTLTGASDLTIHIGAKQLQRVYDNNCNRYSSDDERIKHTLADIVGFGVGTATICTDWNNEIVDLDPASYVFTVQDFNAPKASIPSLERCGGNTSFTLSVCNMPTKTQYYVGESFDQSGLALTATYSDGSTKTITSGFTCTGFSSATNGAKTITVSYEGKTTTFVVFVENKPIITIHDYTANKTVDYRTTITFSVDEIQNPVPDAQVYWFINGQNQGASDTYTEREATTGFTVQAKYIRAGSVLAESEVEAVKVNNGFFARLVAFFRGLFGRLPKIVQAYVGAKERGE